jgi:L-seryl-tRNA(Ser) seleniumtransferase
VRVDKMTLAALELLLRAARSPDCALQTVPLWSMLATSVDRLTARAERLAPQLAALGLDVSIEPSTAEIGGGSAPLHPVASVALCLSPPFPGDFPTEGSLARALRLGDPVIVSRATHGHLWLDLRTVLESQDDLLVRAIAAAFVPG